MYVCTLVRYQDVYVWMNWLECSINALAYQLIEVQVTSMNFFNCIKLKKMNELIITKTKVRVYVRTLVRYQDILTEIWEE